MLSEEKKRRASLTELQAIGQKGFARESDVAKGIPCPLLILVFHFLQTFHQQFLLKQGILAALLSYQQPILSKAKFAY